MKKKLKSISTDSNNTKIYMNNDNHYKGGMFCFNKKVSKLFVEKRLGIDIQ